MSASEESALHTSSSVIKKDDNIFLLSIVQRRSRRGKACGFSSTCTCYAMLGLIVYSILAA